MFLFALVIVLLDCFVVAQKNVGDRCVEQYMHIVGRCEYVSDCQSAQRDYMLSGLFPTYCESANDDHEGIVCCKDRSSILEIEKTTRFRKLEADDIVASAPPEEEKPESISQKKCVEYSGLVSHKINLAILPNQKLTVSSANCQFGARELVIGGMDAALGEFPHMVAVGWLNYEDLYAFNCGGSLISDQFVMTAGHCAHYASRSVRTPAPVVVRLGDQNLDANVLDGASPIDVSIKQIYQHPKYKSPSRYDDIALIQLASKVTFNSNIRPACLWVRKTFDFDKAVATGWGVVDVRANRKARNLQKVALSIMDSATCEPMLESIKNRNWHGFVESQICAGELSGGMDTCQGDSGAPLQVISSSNPCVYYIIGITSFGHNCAEKNRPAVYTRVSSYIDWIESVVWPNESK